MAYTKLFSSIITSTIWSEDDQTRIVWITLLAMADINGEVQGSVTGIARIAGVETEKCREALNKFLSPDPDSRTVDDEGRRIEAIDGGWTLLNHSKYREAASDDDRKKKAAIRQRRFRERQARNANSNAYVTSESHQIPHTESNPHSEAEEKKVKGAKKSREFFPRYPYPESQDEMHEVLLDHDIEPDENHDGSFFEQMERNSWKINGKPIFDWISTYEARLQITQPGN